METITRKVDDNSVRSFNEISLKYPDDYIVVEVVSINHNIGEECGRAIWLCNSFIEAWDAGIKTPYSQMIILEGIKRMNTMGVAL